MSPEQGTSHDGAGGRRRGSIRIGTGAGFADDRIAPAVELVDSGRLDYLVFECLAERTIALAELERRTDPELGYNRWLGDRMRAVLAVCRRQGIRIITNMGAANPVAAANEVARIAAELGLISLRIAVVTGDNVLDLVRQHPDLPLLDRDGTVASLGQSVVSANAYLGCSGIVDALRLGADVVITGRVSDPSLYIGPLIHEFGWDAADWDLIGKAAAVGHLLECGAQVTGGYFADPGVKDVSDLAHVGFPIAEISSDGSFTVSKVAGSGGRVTVATCTEQLLYEVHDPRSYLSADVIADFSRVELREVAFDVVSVTGATGRRRPADLKVSVGYLDGFLGSGEISYAGPNAVARAGLALAVVRERLSDRGFPAEQMRYELIGVNSAVRGLPPGSAPSTISDPAEVRVRVAGRTPSRQDAEHIAHEVSSLWLNGPAGGGGVGTDVTERIAIASVLLPRQDIQCAVEILEV